MTGQGDKRAMKDEALPLAARREAFRRHNRRTGGYLTHEIEVTDDAASGIWGTLLVGDRGEPLGELTFEEFGQLVLRNHLDDMETQYGRGDSSGFDRDGNAKLRCLLRRDGEEEVLATVYYKRG